MSETTIRRRDVLIEMENKETSDGRPNLFSIQFYINNGELVSLIRAKSAGLRYDMKKFRQRGVQAVDEKGNPLENKHPYPVSIDNIREFNGKRVYI